MNLYIFNETSRRGSIFGVGTYIRELTSTLKDSEIKVCVVNYATEKQQIQKEEIDGIQYWHFPAPLQWTVSNPEQWSLYYRNIVYILQLHIKDKKDLIFHLIYNESGKLAEELKKTFNAKIIAVVQFSKWGLTIYDNLPRLRTILIKEDLNNFEKNLKESFEEEKMLYSQADRIICLSNYMKEILCWDYGLEPAKICVIPNCLADKLMSIPNIKNLRSKWLLPAKEKIILFSGRMDEIKGLHYLIRAFREVLEKFQACRLIIAGSGNYDICLQEAKEICTKITFTGFLGKEELYELYQIADVGVVPSLFEPFGYVAAEMMMHELPIVATTTSGLNEVVDDTCGLKVHIAVLQDNVVIDTKLLSEKILYLLQHTTEAKKMGRKGRIKFLKEFSSKIFRKNMLQIYQSLYRKHESIHY
jgi:glycosyltransferase